jgi:hypothetical protein
MTTSCQWIEGEPSEDDACKCGKPAAAGRPYCPPHEARAYVRVDPQMWREFARSPFRLFGVGALLAGR